MGRQEKSILMRIQETVVKYTDIVSQISGVDVEVVDDRLYRVAGTGIFSGRVNENMAAEGYCGASSKMKLVRQAKRNCEKKRNLEKH